MSLVEEIIVYLIYNCGVPPEELENMSTDEIYELFDIVTQPDYG